MYRFNIYLYNEKQDLLLFIQLVTTKIFMLWDINYYYAFMRYWVLHIDNCLANYMAMKVFCTKWYEWFFGNNFVRDYFFKCYFSYVLIKHFSFWCKFISEIILSIFSFESKKNHLWITLFLLINFEEFFFHIESKDFWIVYFASDLAAFFNL